MTGCVQCRFSFSSPPNAFFIAPSRGREDMGLHRRQVQDVLADEPLRDHESVGIDVVEADELVGQIADGVADVDPGLIALVEMDVAKAVRLHDWQLLVFRLAQVGVDDHRPVVARVNQLRLVAVLFHRVDHAVELPRRASTNPERKNARRC